MTPLFLTSPELLEEYWDSAAIHFEPVVRDAARGEFTVEDIKHLCEQKRATTAVVIEDGQVILALAFEFIHYPQISACNIMALGGTRLTEAENEFFVTFREWCKSMNVTVIEASCSSVMSRLLRRYGFAKTYEVVRLSV
jgi:hypothetical protein